jgi:hypothetical protein
LLSERKEEEEEKEEEDEEEGCLGRMPPRNAAALVEVAWRRPPAFEASARGYGQARTRAIAANAVAAFIPPYGRCGR